MNGAYLHLIICHIPIMGAASTVLLILFSLFRKSKELKQVSLWFAVITGIVALAAYASGSGAEEIVKSLPGMTESTIEPHEEIALFFLIALVVIGFISLLGLLLSRASASVLHKFVIIVLVLNLLTSYLAVKTSLTGDKIRHTEIVDSNPEITTDIE
ncbi:MAG: hypothetical protein V1904_00835 [Bacteroidota bacterium]